MAAKLLLCIAADQATVAVWRQRRLTAIRRFENNQDGLIAFGNYLREARGLPVRIMVDTLDEDYRFETLPHASPRDRAQMANRKLRQLYRATPYAAWSVQGSIAGKRREDRYLFSALTDPEQLAPWLRAIDLHRTPVAGIHPLPMVMLSLIERLKLQEPNLLIVSKTGAGLRQTFCKNLQFRLSRLTGTRSMPDSGESFFAEEIGNTRMYLDALTVTHVDDTVTALILDHDSSLGNLATAVSRERPNIHCLHLDREEISSRIGIPVATLAEFPDALHLYMLAIGKTPPDFAPPAVETGFQVYRARQIVFATAAACAVGAVVWAGVNSYRMSQMEDEIQQLARDAQRYESLYRQVTAQFPESPVSAFELRDTVEAANRIRAELRMPGTMMVVVSRALDALPDIALKQFEWHHGDKAAALEGAWRADDSATPGTQTFQAALITAEVRGHSGDYRAVLNGIQDFAARLAANERVKEVRVVRLPVDVSSDAGLSGTTAGDRRTDMAEFQVAIRFRKGI
ncbi:MAG: hypothetical protein WDZ63_10380 [Burkholderiales bacterium]